MSFLRTEDLERRVPAEEIVTPYNKERIEHGAYELAFGSEAYRTDDEVKQLLQQCGDQFVIRTGQFALLLTRERVAIPNDLMAFISIKSTTKLRGLINVSGFHIDPGYHGRLIVGVYNAGGDDIVLERHQQLFPVWFATLNGRTSDVYDGGFRARRHIETDDIHRIRGDLPSLKSLHDRVRNLETNLKTSRAWIIGLGISLLTLLIVNSFL